MKGLQRLSSPLSRSFFTNQTLSNVFSASLNKECLSFFQSRIKGRFNNFILNNNPMDSKLLPWNPTSSERTSGPVSQFQKAMIIVVRDVSVSHRPALHSKLVCNEIWWCAER